MMYREPDPHADAIGFEPTAIPQDAWHADSALAEPAPGTHATLSALMTACRPWGGLFEGETLARMLQERGMGDFSLLAKAIVARQVIAVEHASHLWIPAFQFEADLSVRTRVRRIVHELRDVFDAAGLVMWFTERNTWLRDNRPLDWVDSHFGDVWNAACADRFVASGHEGLQ